MAAATPLGQLMCFFLTALVLSVWLPSAVSQSAPAPSEPKALNISNILENARQYSMFIRLLNETRAVDRINNQAANSNEGVTVFAPTDNAFANLPTGALNRLSSQQQEQLVLYHALPKYYTLESLQTVSNPVRTLATGRDGGVFGLNFTGSQGNQLNVSSGLVDVQIYNTLRKDFPLAVYQVDKVLLPKEFNETKPATAPPPSTSTGGRPTPSGGAQTPAPTGPGNGCGKLSTGFGFVSLVGLLCVTL